MRVPRELLNSRFNQTARNNARKEGNPRKRVDFERVRRNRGTQLILFLYQLFDIINRSNY